MFTQRPHLAHVPPGTHISPLFSPPLTRLAVSYSQKPKVQSHEHDPKPRVPRDSHISVGALPESWLQAPEAKVFKSLAGWWE